MNGPDPQQWHRFNRASLSAELARIRNILDAREGGGTPTEPPPSDATMLSAMDRLCETFDLSAFERDVVLLCAGVETDADLAERCARAQGNPQWTRPTVGFVLATLPGANWHALSPSGVLRRMEIVRLDTATELVRTPMGIDEAVLHFLLDGVYRDPELEGVATELRVTPSPVAEHKQAVAQALAFWAPAQGRLPVLQLTAREMGDGLAAMALLCKEAGMPAWRIDATALVALPAQTGLRRLVRHWQRLARLFEAAAVVVVPDETGTDALDAAWRFADAVEEPVAIVVRDRRGAPRPGAMVIDLSGAGTASRRALWNDALAAQLGTPPDPAAVEQLAATFDLGIAAIETVAAVTSAEPHAPDGVPTPWLPAVWAACRQQARGQLDQLAQRIISKTGWDGLVLPATLTQALRDLTDQVRHRTLVHETWGLAPDGSRGAGIAALFCGASGTGKTLAAEVIAHDLDLDLYRIDLSATVSKYIGETEKNLARIFDAAEAGGAVLLFDEADALFGKRSEVQDSHDRYANIEVGYLLQRIEAYRGLALLTTNLRESLDSAFLRRLRFVLDFPFPDQALRAKLWTVALPASVPQQGVEPSGLARLMLAGGQIRSVSLNAAFLAAADGGVLRPKHLLTAVRREYTKMGRALSESELMLFGDPMAATV
jgi:hypothetical protein